MSSWHSNVLSFTLEKAGMNQGLLKYDVSVDVEIAIKVQLCPAVTLRDTQSLERRVEMLSKERNLNHGNE